MALFPGDLWRRLLKRLVSPSRENPSRYNRRRKASVLLRLEELETRLAPAVVSAVATHGHATVHGYLTNTALSYSQIQGGVLNGATEVLTQTGSSFAFPLPVTKALCDHSLTASRP